MATGGTIPTERQVQRAILKMIRACFPATIVHHSPNGAHLAGGSASRFKQMGALRGDGMQLGWPDLVVIWNGGVAFIEVKRAKLSKTSPEQIAMLDALKLAGWPASIIKSVEEAHAFLKGCGAPCVGELS